MVNDVTDYINVLDQETKQKFIKLREIALSLDENLEEKISYKMPTYKLRRNVFHFADNKKHIGFYVKPEVIEKFATKLKEFEVSKGTIRISKDKEMPYDLIRDIMVDAIKMEKAGT